MRCVAHSPIGILLLFPCASCNVCVSHITDPIDGTVSIHETIPPPGTVGMVHGSYNILLLQQYTIVVSRIRYKGAHYYILLILLVLLVLLLLLLLLLLLIIILLEGGFVCCARYSSIHYSSGYYRKQCYSTMYCTAVCHRLLYSSCTYCTYLKNNKKQQL